MRALAKGADMSSRQIVPSRQIITLSEAGDPAALSAIELNRMLPLEKVAELTSLSVDSIKRHYPHLIRHLSPRRQAIRLGDALSIGNSASS
jgi:hypothetical protein